MKGRYDVSKELEEDIINLYPKEDRVAQRWIFFTQPKDKALIKYLKNVKKCVSGTRLIITYFKGVVLDFKQWGEKFIYTLACFLTAIYHLIVCVLKFPLILLRPIYRVFRVWRMYRKHRREIDKIIELQSDRF